MRMLELLRDKRGIWTVKEKRGVGKRQRRVGMRMRRKWKWMRMMMVCLTTALAEMDKAMS